MSLTDVNRKPKAFKSVGASVTSTKLVHPAGRLGITPGRRDAAMREITTLGKISGKTTNAINNAENTLELLPDVELGMQILVSAILSPNDMTEVALTWTAENCSIDSALTSKLINILKDYFEGEYKLKEQLSEWLRDALFKTGSYPLMVVPESTIDDIINNKSNASMESLKELTNDSYIMNGLGILGPGPGQSKENKKLDRKASIESLGQKTVTNASSKSSFDENTHITDNYSTLKLPTFFERVKSSRVSEAIGRAVSSAKTTSMESKGATDKEASKYDVARMLYSNRQQKGQMNVTLSTAKNASRATVGHPLSMRLPSDSVIPAHKPGSPHQHLGYYVLIDEFGNPVNNASESAYLSEMRERYKQEKTFDQAVMDQMKKSAWGAGCGGKTEDLNSMYKLYVDAVEDDLLTRLRNGLYGENVEISNVDDVYQIMFARTLQRKNTQLLYVPEELMTYVAFDYNSFGVGRSLLEKTEMIGSLRTVMMFANAMSAVKNSVARQNININIDEEDVDPDQTVELVLHEIARVQSQAFPLETSRPADIIDGIRNAAKSVTVSGHPNYSSTSVEVNDVATNRTAVDDQLESTYAQRHAMSWGLPPEMVESSTSIDYATELLQRNVLFNKRRAVHATTTESFITDHVYKYTVNDGILMADLISTVTKFFNDEKETKERSEREQDIKDAKEMGVETSDEEKLPDSISEIIEHFLNCLTISLPTPDNTTLEGQINSVEKYSRGLDVVLDGFITEDSLMSILGTEGRDQAPAIRSMIKGYFIRKYISEQNIMPEVTEMLSAGATKESELDDLQSDVSHMSGLAGVLVKLMEKSKERIGTAEDESGNDRGW